MFYNLRSGSCYRILVCVLEIDECDLIVFGIISAQIGIISAQIGIFCDPFCVLVIGIISTKIGMWFNRINGLVCDGIVLAANKLKNSMVQT